MFTLAFVLHSHHFTLVAYLSILVSVPFNIHSIFGVTVQLSQPYRRIDSAAAAENLTLIYFFMFKFHMQFILLSACQACAYLIFMSLSVLSTHDPRYLKASTFSNSIPSFVFRAVHFVSMLYVMYLVFLALTARPTFWHSL